MAIFDEKLKSIVEKFEGGIAPEKETVRSFLSWFGAKRRGNNVVNKIRAALDKYQLITNPDFEYAYVDSYIEFQKVTMDGGLPHKSVVEVTDPTNRIGRLASANIPPMSVKPDDSLQLAITKMLSNDYSQLPVMTSQWEVKGIVSWKTIGSRLALGKTCHLVRECMNPATEVLIDESFFSALEKLSKSDYVLVRSNDNTISGIITASDFNDQFRNLAEPFLLVGEIENGIRKILHGKFSTEELDQSKFPGDERTIDSMADLTIGECVHLIQSEQNWKKLNVPLDRAGFVERLDKVRDIRNDVMHFDPDGLEESDLSLLRGFAGLMKTLRDFEVV